MVKTPVLLIDLKVLLDVLQARQPFYQASAQVLARIESGKAVGYLAAHSFTTLFYLIEKSSSASQAKAHLTNILQILRVAPVDQGTIEQALNLVLPDFEDAVQMICALQCKADYLVTRDPKGFQPALLPVVQPVELIQILDS